MDKKEKEDFREILCGFEAGFFRVLTARRLAEKHEEDLKHTLNLAIANFYSMAIKIKNKYGIELDGCLRKD